MYASVSPSRSGDCRTNFSLMHRFTGQAESRRAKRKRRGWKDIYIDGNRLEKNWKGGKYSTKLVKRSVQAQESAYCIKFDDHRMVTGRFVLFSSTSLPALQGPHTESTLYPSQ
jgi:hypothetical protein